MADHGLLRARALLLQRATTTIDALEPVAQTAVLRLARGGASAAASLLSYESTIGYVADLLLLYASRQTFTPRKRAGAQHWLTWKGSW